MILLRLRLNFRWEEKRYIGNLRLGQIQLALMGVESGLRLLCWHAGFGGLPSLLRLLLHLQHRLQRPFAEMAGGGVNAPLGGFDGSVLRRRGGAACGSDVRGLAGFLGAVDTALAMEGADAALALGFLRLRRGRRVDDRRQGVMARHGLRPVEFPRTERLIRTLFLLTNR